MKRFKIAVVVIACCAMASCATLSKRRTMRFPSSEIETSYTYLEGIKLKAMHADQAKQASYFRAVLAADSTHAPSYYELAMMMAISDTERAIRYCTAASRLDTANIWYRNLLGRLMVYSGRYNEAFDIYTSLLKKAPNPENYRMLAALYQEKGQPFSAISLLDSAEYKFGRIEELADMKRQLLIGVKMFDRAIEQSKAIIADYPWNDRNYMMLGTLYDQTGKDSLAEATLRQAVTMNPSSVENLDALNTFYRRKNNLPGFFSTANQMMALDELPLRDKLSMVGELVGNRALYMENFFQIKEMIATLLIKYPNEQAVIDLYGNSLIAMSGPESGLAFFKGFLKDPSPRQEIFNTVIDIEAYLNRPDSVAKYAEMAIRSSSAKDNVDLYIRLGGAQAYMKQPDKALTSYNMALRNASTDSTRSVVLGIIGDLYHQQDNNPECYKYYKRSLRAWKDNAMVLNNFSYYLSIDGPDGRDLGKAVDMARRATTLSPGNATYLDTYAWALFKAGDIAQAKKIMQQAVSLDTDGSMELMLHYGDILFASGDKFMATIYWRKALEKGYDAQQIANRLKQAGN